MRLDVAEIYALIIYVAYCFNRSLMHAAS